MRGTFYGGVNELIGKTALIEERPNGKVVAQFDDLNLAPWCFGWHEFGRHEFIVTTSAEEGDDFYDDHSHLKNLHRK